MITTSQRVRQYQQARALAKRADFPSLAKYRPDQERDPRGRFADEGKGGAGGGSSATASAGSTRASSSARSGGRGGGRGGGSRASANVNVYNDGGGSRGGGGDGGGDGPTSFGVSGEIGPGVHASTSLSGFKGLAAVAGTALAYALVRNPQLFGQVVRMVRNPAQLRAAWNSFMRELSSTSSRLRPDLSRARPFNRPLPPPPPRTPPPKPKGTKPSGSPKIKPSPKGKPIKPAADIGARQARRRAADVRAAAAGDAAAGQRIAANVEATRAARAAAAARSAAPTSTAVARTGGTTSSGNLVPATGRVPTATSRAASVVDAQAAQAALRRYETLVTDTTRLQANIESKTNDIYRTTGQLYNNRPSGFQPRGTVERELADIYDELASARTRMGAARQEVVEWEDLLGGAIAAPITDVASAPVRGSVLDSLRRALGRSNKRATSHLTKAQQVRQYQLARKDALLEKRSIPRFEKYRADQERDDGGKFEDEGKGTAGGGGARWGRRAAVAGGLLAAGAAATPQGRALVRAGLLRTAARARAGNLAATRAEARLARAESAKLNARIQQMLERSETAGAPRGILSRLRRAAVRSTQARARQADQAISRVKPFNARPNQQTKPLRRLGGEAKPDAGSKLIELPDLGLWPF